MIKVKNKETKVRWHLCDSRISIFTFEQNLSFSIDFEHILA